MMHFLKLKKNRRGRGRTGALLGSFLGVLLVFAAPQAAEADETVIKVGYTGSGSVIVDESGEYSGYTVDYLEEIAEYTGWEYEYVYGTWTDCADMLENGQLDLIGMVRHTQEREERFLFSELTMAYDYTILYANADSDIYYQEYEAINGCRVGVVEGSIHEEAFKDYAQNLGLAYEMVRFSSVPQAEAALREGTVDFLASAGISSPSGMKLVDRFQMSPAYFVTGKENQALMQELNAAMQEARIENAQLETELIRKYYSTSNIVNKLLLTREEQEYIDSAAPIIVKGVERRPLNYEDKGRFIGVLTDYINLLGELTGLTMVSEKTDILSLEEHSTMMAEEYYLLIYENIPLESSNLEEPMLASTTLFESSLSYIKHKNAEGNANRTDYVFALTGEMSHLEELLHSRSQDFEIRYYESPVDCMEAVLNGEADITIQDEYVATYLLEKPKYEDALVECEGEEMVRELCLYASADQYMLIQILNKAVDSLTEEERASIVANSMIDHPYAYGLEDFLYDYGTWVRLFITLLLAICILGIVLYTKIRNFRLQKRENEELQERIQLDELTGLYNRTYFFEKAREMIERSEKDICIIRINICNFKIVNEIYGAEKGDRLLCEMAHGLQELSRQKKYIVGRFTGDHFYLCIEQGDFEKLAFPRQIPTPWLGMDITLTYGVYLVGGQKDVPINIMCDRANMANAAQGQSTAEYIRYYSDEERQRLLREQEIENEMEKAVAERQFCIYIQPKYDIETEKIVGGEALVRWIHPQKGMIPPGEFIGLFERNGFIQKLDYYVWEECCRFLSEEKKKGIKTYPLSMNVSRVHFYSSELQDKLTGLLDRYHLNPKEVELEITETVCAEDPEIIFSKCRELREAGFLISMDDFGSGYSSLNMLKEMPLDIIKMDLRFLAGEANEEQKEKGHNILQKLIELAHTLELKVVVEGLETREQKEFIQEIGNCSAQGYYFSRPIDCQSYEAMISGD